MLLGRRTWEKFSGIWPNGTDDFSLAMNKIPKLVVSNTSSVLDTWNNSALLDGDLVDGVARVARERDVVVAGSTSIVHTLAAPDAVDEYRLLVFPAAIGAGTDRQCLKGSPYRPYVHGSRASDAARRNRGPRRRSATSVATECRGSTGRRRVRSPTFGPC